MTGFDTSRLSPEVAAYIRSLETRVEKIEVSIPGGFTPLFRRLETIVPI